MGNRTNLYIANVTDAKGIYTCKATNDYGSEISSPAELKIKGTPTFAQFKNSLSEMKTVFKGFFLKVV